MTQHQSTPQNVHLQSLSTTKEEKIPNFHRQNLPYKQLLTIPRARNQTQKESNPCAGLSLSLSLSLSCSLARSVSSRLPKPQDGVSMSRGDKCAVNIVRVCTYSLSAFALLFD